MRKNTNRVGYVRRLTGDGYVLAPCGYRVVR